MISGMVKVKINSSKSQVPFPTHMMTCEEIAECIKKLEQEEQEEGKDE
jgi:hypothetical protein